MRFQGRITNWKDDQGFGFVTQNATGGNAFVHIKAFSSRSRRPVEGDLITYELGRDERGRTRADNVRFVAERARPTPSAGSLTLGTAIAILFCCLLVLAVLLGRLPVAVLGLYGVASVAAFTAYAMDKAAARANHWRTREQTLHLLGVIGGWPGALVAQNGLRHKSRKASFLLDFWTTVAANCGALVWLSTGSGSEFVKSILGH